MAELTTEIVKRALQNGEVEYNLRGDLSAVDPVAARNVLLHYAAEEHKDPEVDLSLVFD